MAIRSMKSYNFNISNKIVGIKPKDEVSLKYVVDRYNVTKEQLLANKKNLRYVERGGTYYFDLKQIRSRYQPDSYKLETLVKVEAMKRDALAIPKSSRL